jgi:hypothetical protein
MFRWFVFGILAIVVAIPIMDMIMEIISLSFEIFKGKLTIQVLKNNNKITTLQNEIEPQYSSAIGYDLTSTEDLEEYDDENDKLSNKNKLKIGF